MIAQPACKLKLPHGKKGLRNFDGKLATPVFLIFGKIIYARKLCAKYAAARITNINKYGGV